MRHRAVRSALLALTCITGAAGAASAQTCIRIDEQHDTLQPDERTAARLMVGKQFALAGHKVADENCAATYLISHIRLGTTISVTLTGPAGTREATALGLDDLPAVYSQMVKSLTTGQPMGLAVVDRSNVSATQDLPPRRVRAEGYWYARVGFGSLFSDTTQNGASFGFGYRAGFDRLALDVSFLNAQLSNDAGYYGSSGSVWSLIKLQGLMFTHPNANRSAYFGGGLSYSRAAVRAGSEGGYPRTGYGSGLQGDLTAGYEITRARSTRVFVQTDIGLPFYHVQVETLTYPETTSPSGGRVYLPPTVSISRQYTPSIAVSLGFGWQGRSR
jgi:hypothetical protein